MGIEIGMEQHGSAPKKKLGLVLGLFFIISISSFGFAYAQSNNGTSTSPPVSNSTGAPPTNSTTSNKVE